MRDQTHTHTLPKLAGPRLAIQPFRFTAKSRLKLHGHSGRRRVKSQVPCWPRGVSDLGADTRGGGNRAGGGAWGRPGKKVGRGP